MNKACFLVCNFLLLLLLSLSCAKGTQRFYPVDYNVINNSGSRIKVVFNGILGTYGPYVSIDDSIVFIDPSKEFKLIVLCELSQNGVNNPEEDNDSLYAISTLRIYKYDSIISATNFKLTQYWNYHKISNQHAELNLEVTDSDFK
jgi:hypothetical protein